MLRKSCVIKSERIDGMERCSNSTITNTFTCGITHEKRVSIASYFYDFHLIRNSSNEIDIVSVIISFSG